MGEFHRRAPASDKHREHKRELINSLLPAVGIMFDKGLTFKRKRSSWILRYQALE